MKTLFSNLLDLIFPDLCTVCETKLVNNEAHLCLSCYTNLPLTIHQKNVFDNDLVNLFAGKFPFEKVASYSYYTKGGSMQKIIHDIKYHHNTDLAIYIGYIAAQRFKTSKLFTDIDYLVPIPLHKKRLKERGYNQAELIANGISDSCRIPICTDNIRRKIYNVSQTRNSKTDRWTNVDNIFEIADPDFFKDKHILLIDDVITTGSTLESCIKTIVKKNNTKISIFSIALAI